MSYICGMAKSNSQGRRLEWLRSVMAGTGLSVIDFSKRVGMNYQAVSMMNSGTRIISDLTVNRICKVFAIPPPMDMPVPMPVPESPEDISALRSEIKELQRQMKRMDDQLKVLSRPPRPAGRTR